MSDQTVSVLIVDDSALYRQSIQNVMREIPDVTVVGIAKNGVEAIAKIDQHDPDLLTLDVQMPDMDGIEVLREIKARSLRAKAIMVSSFTAAGTQVTTDALMEGAFDFILKPSSTDSRQNRQQLRDGLQQRIDAFRTSRDRISSAPACEVATDEDSSDQLEFENGGTQSRRGEVVPRPKSPCRVVMIGASTGGPAALKQVLPKFPANTPSPVVVVQHMPSRFTSSLARRLDGLCPCRVEEATDGMPLRNGHIIIAKGGEHLRLRQADGQLFAKVSSDAPVNGLRPAIDVLIQSSVDVLGGDALAIILTGMGRDGLNACRELKKAGGFVFAQSRDDCVVYGMPKAVTEDGLADRTLTLGKVAPAALRHLKRSHRDV